MGSKGIEAPILVMYDIKGKKDWEWFFTEEEVSNFLSRYTTELTAHQVIRINSYDQIDVSKLWKLRK